MNPTTHTPGATFQATPSLVSDTSPLEPPISLEKATTLKRGHCDLVDGSATPTESSSTKDQKLMNTATATPGVTFQVTPNLTRGTFPPKKPPISLEKATKLKRGYSDLVDGSATSAKNTTDSEKGDVFLPPSMHGFIDAVSVAFDEHFPLALRPQHIWVLITQAVAEHVDLNAEALRSRWVKHIAEGSKVRLIVSRNGFTRGEDADNDWAGVVCGSPDSLVEQIKQYVADGVADEIMPTGLSGTTDVELVSMGITVMDTLKRYFEYGMTTLCGFPSITMEGTEDDWRFLRTAAERLITNRCLPEFAAHWTPILLPLLDKFVDEYHKAASGSGVAADEKFWNSILKRGARHGSGAYSYISGWINIFFPIVTNRDYTNSFCKPYMDIVNEKVKWGTDVSYFPNGMSRAPVEWNYLGNKINLGFNAGFVCAEQDPGTCAVRPHLAWYVTDPKKGSFVNRPMDSHFDYDHVSGSGSGSDSDSDF